MNKRICSNCKTQPATLTRGRDAFCIDCFNEPPVVPLVQWDKVMTPARILALEARMTELEHKLAEWEADS